MIATYLKKSSRQKSLASREKHFSDSGLPQSAHWTHFECQALSRTFNKKRSVIGLAQPAHSTMFDVSLPISASDHAGTELSQVCKAAEYICNLCDDLRDTVARCQCELTIVRSQ